MRLAAGFASLCSNNNSPLTLLNRYQARLHHEYLRILKSLQQMQAARQRQEAKIQSEPNPISEQSNIPISPPDNGIDVATATRNNPIVRHTAALYDGAGFATHAEDDYLRRFGDTAISPQDFRFTQMHFVASHPRCPPAIHK